jgi:hypothetical protein
MSLFLIDLGLIAIRRDISTDQKCQIFGGDLIKSKNLILCTPVLIIGPRKDKGHAQNLLNENLQNWRRSFIIDLCALSVRSSIFSGLLGGGMIVCGLLFNLADSMLGRSSAGSELSHGLFLILLGSTKPPRSLNQWRMPEAII